jgi:hypothetical protein
MSTQLLVRVAPGPAPSLDDLAWDERARALEAETLPNIRASAGKWAAGISSLTGIFATIAVLKGPDQVTKLPSPWRGVVILLVALAFLLAVYGTFEALMAAQGGPASIRPIGREVRDLYHHQASVAADQLNTSRWAVIGAVGLLALALLVTWIWTPQSAAKQVMVVEVSGMTTCGDLKDGDPGFVTVLPSGTDKPAPIPISQVAAVRTVTSC